MTVSVAHLIRTYRAPKTSCEVHDVVRVFGFVMWHTFNGRQWVTTSLQISAPYCVRCNSVTSFQVALPVPNAPVPEGITQSNLYVTIEGRELLCS